MFKKDFMLRLAKMLMQFAEVETNKGKLTYEGELMEGTEVFMEVEGNLVPAEDGEYIIEGAVLMVEGGRVIEIRKDEPTEDPEPQEMEDERVAELEAKVAELEAIIAERDLRIAELEAKLVEKEEQLKMSVAKPVHKEIKDLVISNKENKALKFFN